MSEAERIADLRMNGERVAEIDLQASHLSMLSGLAGCPLDPEHGDPYDVPGVPRAIAKRWIVATLGKGSPLRRAPRGAGAIFAGFDMAALRRAILARHPVLEDPAAVVPVGLVERYGDARVVLPHYLAGIEAEALTDATRHGRRGTSAAGSSR